MTTTVGESATTEVSGAVFPFGQRLRRVEQSDRNPKRVFVLGVYSSAVHARWITDAGRVIVNALAVANEPYIFWGGDAVDQVLSMIHVPPAVGRLVSPPPGLNGPSGVALDKLFLSPLGGVARRRLAVRPRAAQLHESVPRGRAGEGLPASRG